MKKVDSKICLGVASVHFILFMLTAIYIASIEDGQAPMLWGLFYFIDYPVGHLITAFGEPYNQWLDSLTYPISAIFFYPPHIIFGVIGTSWYFLIAKIFLQLADWKNTKK